MSLSSGNQDAPPQSRLRNLLSQPASKKRDAEILELIFSAPLHRPDLVYKFRDAISYWGKYTTRHWDAVEQVCIAALELGYFDEFMVYARIVLDWFPKSWRIYRLLGMRREARGDFDEAALIYRNTMLQNPTSTHASKRQVAWLKSQGRVFDATLVLNKYLEIFSQDHVAWIEQSELYLRLGLYPQAEFCMSETLLYNPTNWALNLRVADILFTKGTQADVLSARAYYAQSLLENQATNYRALYGLWMATRTLNLWVQDGSWKGDSKNYELQSWVVGTLKHKCLANQDPLPMHLQILQKTLEAKDELES
mmetsp:Transcript_8167/g.21450  ORF Transcript_8167/g.21450 Transcript_8167/m.21450 type:complete len:309 (-) Transcript_8167:859-1785(-)